MKLKFWEKFYWKKADLVATMSGSDKKIIRQIEPKIKPVIIPNGAGDDMFISKLKKKNLQKPALLFVGNFYWLQNTEAAHYLLDKLYPKLIKVVPNLKLIIGGQNASKVLSYKKRGVKIVDIKPDDNEAVTNLYHSATIFLAPILGPGGTRLKVLAAMASGVPIVSTKTGVEGLDVEDQKHVAIADNIDDFVKEIKNTLSNEKKYYKLQQNAYQLANEKYSWQSISKKLEDVYKEIISEK